MLLILTPPPHSFAFCQVKSWHCGTTVIKRSSMATVRSQLNNFEIEEFFRSLTTWLTSFNANVSFDLAEYISCRHDVYERNLSLLFARLSESHHPEEQLLSDICSLLEVFF